MAASDTTAGTEHLQDLLLDSPGFTEFLLGLSTISASVFSGEASALCAITVERDGGPTTVASSTTTARKLDEKQYAIDDGPCLTALREQHIVMIPDLAADSRWHRYAEAVAAEGVRSVLAVPIPTDGSSCAALNYCGAGVSLIDPQGRRTSAGFTDEVVKEADRLQCELGAGPCLTAWALEEPVLVDDVATDTRWPEWSRAVQGLRFARC
jgi:GAF domain-containing protein